jgi:hypothetical protein
VKRHLGKQEKTAFARFSPIEGVVLAVPGITGDDPGSAVI